MKGFEITCSGIAILATITGCCTAPHYLGDGQIKKTSYWADGVVHTTQYTIRLGSFNMCTNTQKEFDIGTLSYLRDARVTVCIRFRGRRPVWDHFDKLSPSERSVEIGRGWHDIDSLKSRFSYRLSNQFGTLIAQPPTPLKDYNWGGGEFDTKVGPEVEISNLEHVRTQIPKGNKLKLFVSYTGDRTMTNRAEFVVLWQWR